MGSPGGGVVARLLRGKAWGGHLGRPGQWFEKVPYREFIEEFSNLVSGVPELSSKRVERAIQCGCSNALEQNTSRLITTWNWLRLDLVISTSSRDASSGVPAEPIQRTWSSTCRRESSWLARCHCGCGRTSHHGSKCRCGLRRRRHQYGSRIEASRRSGACGGTRVPEHEKEDLTYGL